MPPTTPQARSYTGRVLAQFAKTPVRPQRLSRSTPVGFVRDQNSEAGPTLALMLREMAEAGEVRLKLLVSMHLIAAGDKHDVTRSPASWAQMLDLPKPETNGARADPRCVGLARRPPTDRRRAPTRSEPDSVRAALPLVTAVRTSARRGWPGPLFPYAGVVLAFRFG